MFKTRASYKHVITILYFLTVAFSARSMSMRRIETPRFWKKISRSYKSLYSNQNVKLLIRALRICHLGPLFGGYRQQSVTIIPPTRKIIAKNEMKLVVLTANMFLLPAPFSSNQSHRLKQLKSIIKKENPDLIALQEVWSNDKLSEVINTFPQYYRICSISPLYNMSGLVLLSKHRVINAEKVVFPTCSEYSLQETIAQKGLIKTTLQVASSKINFISTHLYSAGTKAKLKPNYEQFTDIIEYIKGLRYPTIIAGDFNIVPNAINKLNDNQLIVSSNREYTSGIRPHRKLDYIMISPKQLSINAFVDKPISKPRISDHLPLLSTISFQQILPNAQK